MALAMKLLLYLAVLLLALSSGEAAERKPNIIILLADDLGYGELDCQGSTDIPTPNIDSLAREGVRFTQGYVSAPFCCPSRAGLMTGRYQTRFGHEFNTVGKQNLDPTIGLPLSEKTIANHLKAGGYKTALVGKWHLGGTVSFHPQKRGFDEFYGFLHEGHFYAPFDGVTSFLRTNSVGFGESFTNGPIIWSNHVRGNEPPYDESNPLLRGTQEITEPEHLTEAFTREAVGFIDRNQKQPFFLYLAYNAVHSPMQASPKHLERFQHIADPQRRIFAGMLAGLDDSVGAILERLRKLKLEKDTLIFFLSDNGGPTQELTSSNRPLRGGKGQLWEGGIRVPFIVRWKGKLPGGTIYDQPVISLDILPTALAAAQSKVPAQVHADWDGVNLLPYLRTATEAVPHKVLFWRYGGNIALRAGNWKLIHQREPGRDSSDYQLYNLRSDGDESEDMRSAEPDVVFRLRQQMEALNKQMAEPLWGKK